MQSFTVKVSQYCWFYNIEAPSREEAENLIGEWPWDETADDFEMSIEAEETDEL